MKLRPWTRETLYFDSSDYFRALFEAVDDARNSIDLETYIFEMDAIGTDLIARLIAASRRGVRVRVMVDGVGAWLVHDRLAQAFAGTGIGIKVYHPFSFLGPAISNLNKRLHRKLVVIDRKFVFTGSFNITARPNRDTGVRLEGGPIGEFLSAFERTWSHRFSPVPRHRGIPAWVRFNESKRFRRLCNQDLSRRIDSARSRIWATNAYFVPPFFLLRALCQAGLRGVDTRLILPEKPDHRFMKWLSSAYYRTLLLSGVRVFEYRRSFLHAKSWIIDDWGMVGSTNLNHRSLVHDLEVDVVLASAESLGILEAQFEADARDSVELHSGTFKVGLLSRILQWILLRFRFYA